MKKLSSFYNLEIINPTLAEEWHPTKNGNLTPKNVMPSAARKVWWMCKRGHEWLATINHRNNGRECPYCAGQLVCVDNSLFKLNPNLAKEWHPSKNGQLIPKDVTSGSGKKVWWKCNKNHEWQATVSSRKNGAGCPYCAGKLVSEDNCLLFVYPSLAKEWHPNKNGTLTPKGVTPNSHKKVWWLCKKGHEWQAKISGRANGTGCPYCSGQAVCKDNCLQVINLTLASEWHPSRNGKLTPKDVTAGSNKKVWWLCKKGHEWQATVNGRHSKASGCPYCYGRFATPENSLQVANQNLAKEWHPSKNGQLTPKSVTPYSNRKVWWLCKKGHEWQVGVASRSYGAGCPFCSGRRKSRV